MKLPCFSKTFKVDYYIFNSRRILVCRKQSALEREMWLYYRKDVSTKSVNVFRTTATPGLKSIQYGRILCHGYALR